MSASIHHGNARSKEAIVFRADASRSLGSGHVMRLLALADEIVAGGGQSAFAVSADAGAIADEVRVRGHQVHILDVTSETSGDDADAGAVVALARGRHARVVVVDGRRFAAPYLDHLTAAGLQVVALDDVGRRDLGGAVVVNHNPGAGRFAYDYREAMHLLLGRRYHLLRAEFLAHPRGGPALPPPGARLRVLVTFGGSDPTGATPRVLRCLPPSPSLTLCVVVGPGHGDDWRSAQGGQRRWRGAAAEGLGSNHGALAEAARAAAAHGHTVELVSAPADMAWVMARCDAAIAAAGGTLGELAYLGRPTAAYAVVADQEPGACELAAAGMIFSGAVLAHLDDGQLREQLARFLSDHPLRAELARRATRDVDGHGAARVVRALRDL